MLGRLFERKPSQNLTGRENLGLTAEEWDEAARVGILIAAARVYSGRNKKTAPVLKFYPEFQDEYQYSDPDTEVTREMALIPERLSSIGKTKEYIAYESSLYVDSEDMYDGGRIPSTALFDTPHEALTYGLTLLVKKRLSFVKDNLND